MALHQSLETPIPDEESYDGSTIDQNSVNNSKSVENYLPSTLNTSSRNIVAKFNHVLSTSTHSDDFLIPDSGATHNMFKQKTYFASIQPVFDAQGNQAYMEMGDGHLTTIEGFGKAYFEIDGEKVAKYGYYIPTLNNSLLSIREHSSHPGCYFHSENSQSILAFPTFMVNLITDPEISSPISPFSPHQQTLNFDDDTSKLNHPIQSKIVHIQHANLHRPLFDLKSDRIFAHQVLMKTLHPNATLPEFKAKGSIGFDLHYPTDVTFTPNATTIVHTGLSCAIPKGLYM